MQFGEETKKQILIVEDEGLIAVDVQRRLERMGYSVPAIAPSGEEALRWAECTPFDLVLMDIRLKGEMDGIETAAALKAEFETPVVYLTAYFDETTVHRAMLTEPFGYVLKPIVEGNLSSAVQIAIYKSEMERHTSDVWLSDTLHNLERNRRTAAEERRAMDIFEFFADSGRVNCAITQPVLKSLGGIRRSIKAIEKAAEETTPVEYTVLDAVPGDDRNCTTAQPMLKGLNGLKRSIKALEKAVSAPCSAAATCSCTRCAARSSRWLT